MIQQMEKLVLTRKLQDSSRFEITTEIPDLPTDSVPMHLRWVSYAKSNPEQCFLRLNEEEITEIRDYMDKLLKVIDRRNMEHVL